jgi:NAD-dependent dihydropyrimidine dehydrogenase PreA subunit
MSRSTKKCEEMCMKDKIYGQASSRGDNLGETWAFYHDLLCWGSRQCNPSYLVSWISLKLFLKVVHLLKMCITVQLEQRKTIGLQYSTSGEVGVYFVNIRL